MADSEKRGRVCERHGVWCPDGECADCNAEFASLRAEMAKCAEAAERRAWDAFLSRDELIVTEAVVE